MEVNQDPVDQPTPIAQDELTKVTKEEPKPKTKVISARAIPQETFIALFGYLESQPFKQVATLLHLLQNNTYQVELNVPDGQAGSTKG
jgi:hypothetical protein